MLTLDWNKRPSVNDLLRTPIVKARIQKFLSATLHVRRAREGGVTGEGAGQGRGEAGQAGHEAGQGATGGGGSGNVIPINSMPFPTTGWSMMLWSTLIIAAVHDSAD